MFKTAIYIFLALVLPFRTLAQFTISGRILNKTDKKPVENVSVFLSNATVGDKTAADGIFTLRNVKPGKYDLVVTDIAFALYSQPVTVEGSNITLPDIMLSPQVKSLQQVTIQYHADPNREKYYSWFRDAFIGTGERGAQCKILNPEILDFSFEPEHKTLKASSADFLVVENEALGYRIKYLLTDFLMRDSASVKQVRYQGFSLFETLKGSPGQEARWQRARDEVYANSPMHFFRAAIADKLDENNFKAEKLQRSSGKLLPNAVHRRDIISRAPGRNQYILHCDHCDLVVTYNPKHHFHINNHTEYFYNRGNTDNTFVRFNSPEVLIYGLGVPENPYDLSFRGVWGRYKAAELLPIDYEPANSMEMSAGQDVLLAKLDSFSAVRQTEKAYLQFDKPYYAAGDTMYFKAYVTMGERHVPSQISGVLHVDLINTKNKIDQSFKLQITNGIAWGDFALPDSLPKGNYRLRAWTQWMRNDPGGFFEKAIPIGSLQNSRVPESNTAKAATGKPDVQFFPEGGTIVTGIRSRVAFKAIGPSGLGVNVKGNITDNDNKLITSFTSAHLGMGSFELTPEPGKTYKAKLSFADGTTQTIDLPKAEEKGITLSVNNDAIPLAKVRITANDAYFKENKGKDYTLLIYSGGIATTVDCTLDSTVTVLDILKRKLFTGVATITIFSPNNEPLCERLIFVQNYDQLSLNVSTDKGQYAPREKVALKLSAKTRADSAATGHFSVAVTDESKVPNDGNSETTILTDLLLTSDLKGYIEQPNYYFDHINDTTTRNLDVVMLTHGYRRFEWKEILNSNQPAITYQPEHDLSISGTVKTLLGKPVAKGTVSLITYMGGPVPSQTTDGKGNFKFSSLDFTDTVRFVLQAVTDKGKNSTQISLSKTEDEPPVTAQTFLANDTSGNLASYLQNHKEQWDQYAKYGLPGGRLLKEVKIKAVIHKDDNYPSSSLLGPGHADQVMHADEIGKYGGQLSDILNGRLIGVGFRNKALGPGGIPYLSSPPGMGGHMLIVIDGEVTQDSSINIINPQSVETVEVLRFASTSIYGMQGGNGVIIITTKQGKGLDPKDIVSKGVLPVTIQGFYKARQFYAPKYEHPDDYASHKDLRSTVYWQPDVATDKDGNAEISFYNADGKGDYRVVVEGIDEKGNIGRTVYRYRVE
ncbi:MAG: carboxypeptidase regulatory-like domain-containing protein [Bacteroidetes bacterium]|nr:carboxypeptidase regulatory-like domain-containing protein [Bacteroidota bacterium]